jgi:hypothetical protein
MSISPMDGPAETRPVAGQGNDRKGTARRPPRGRHVRDDAVADQVTLSDAARKLSDALEDGYVG